MRGPRAQASGLCQDHFLPSALLAPTCPPDEAGPVFSLLLEKLTNQRPGPRRRWKEPESTEWASSSS